MNEVQRKKCNRCKVMMTFDKFKKKRDDTYMKQCIQCNSKSVKYNNNKNERIDKKSNCIIRCKNNCCKGEEN